MMHRRSILWLAVIGAAGSFAPSAVAAETISVDTATRYQTMTGWEAHARSWEIDKGANAYDPSFVQHAPALAAKVVNELGINRLQLSLKTGWMNPVDYWTPFVNGQMSYTQWGSHSYEKIAGAPYQFGEFDFNVETMLLPMRQQLQARGEKLYVSMQGIDFNAPLNGNFRFSQNPAAYAKFVQAYADRLRTKYGVTLDAFDVTLEPENTDPAYPWRGVEIGNALVALRAMFNAAGYPNLTLIAPSVTNAANTIPYLNAIATVPGALAALNVASYHRYSSGDYAAIRAWAAQRGKQTGMSEWYPATIDTLLEDLLVGQVSFWEKWSVAGKKGGSLNGYYVADLSNPTAPVFDFAPNVAPMALVFRYVRMGAVRVAAQSATMRTVAFVNPDGTHVVVVKRTAGSGATPVTITGLNPGPYGARTIAAGSTQAVNLPDVVAAANGSVTVTLSDGYTTLYGKGSSSGPSPGQLSFAAPTTFGSQTVGTTSVAKTVSISNGGGTAVSIQAIASSNAVEFPISSSTCGTVTPGATCSFMVSFKPAAAGTRTATLTVTSNGVGSPQSLSATGTGMVPTTPGQLSLAATATFGSQTVSSMSAAKIVTIGNIGGSVVTVQSIVSSNTLEFPITSSSCGTLNPGASCTFGIAFKPSAAGTRTAQITVTSNGTGSPQNLNATGIGSTVVTPGQLSFVAGISFSSQAVGSTSSAKSVSITNVGGSAVTVQSIVSNNAGEFPIASSTCGTLNPGSTCTFGVAFRPSATGTRYGTVILKSNGVGSPQNMSASGAGVASVRPDTIDLVEYRHAEWEHYFLTGAVDEIVKLDNGAFAGWARTGQQFKAYLLGDAIGTPVCRFFSTSFAPRSSHFYTPFASECGIVSGNRDWLLESDEVFMISIPAEDGTCAAGANPVYRLYNNGEGAAPNHRYTTDITVRTQMIEQGWTPEGYGPAGVIMCAPQ